LQRNEQNGRIFVSISPVQSYNTNLLRFTAAGLGAVHYDIALLCQLEMFWNVQKLGFVWLKFKIARKLNERKWVGVFVSLHQFKGSYNTNWNSLSAEFDCGYDVALLLLSA
jgi:hypothetical protein